MSSLSANSSGDGRRSFSCSNLESSFVIYDREREILKMFFGIGCQEMTLEEIGAKFDLTRERVRQIKEKAIRRLKGQKSKLLKSYLGE